MTLEESGVWDQEVVSSGGSLAYKIWFALARKVWAMVMKKKCQQVIEGGCEWTCGRGVAVGIYEPSIKGD